MLKQQTEETGLDLLKVLVVLERYPYNLVGFGKNKLGDGGNKKKKRKGGKRVGWESIVRCIQQKGKRGERCGGGKEGGRGKKEWNGCWRG